MLCATSPYTMTAAPLSASRRRCASTAAISSSTEPVARRPEYQPDTSDRPCASSTRASAFDSRGNLLPSSKPSYPIERPSESATSSGVSPPSDGRSSLLQEIGSIPMRTFMAASWVLLLHLLLVRGARLLHGRAIGHGGHRHFPPPAAGVRGAIGIGLDGDHVRASCRARACERGL